MLNTEYTEWNGCCGVESLGNPTLIYKTDAPYGNNVVTINLKLTTLNDQIKQSVKILQYCIKLI